MRRDQEEGVHIPEFLMCVCERLFGKEVEVNSILGASDRLNMMFDVLEE